MALDALRPKGRRGKVQVEGKGIVAERTRVGGGKVTAID